MGYFPKHQTSGGVRLSVTRSWTGFEIPILAATWSTRRCNEAGAIFVLRTSRSNFQMRWSTRAAINQAPKSHTDPTTSGVDLVGLGPPKLTSSCGGNAIEAIGEACTLLVAILAGVTAVCWAAVNFSFVSGCSEPFPAFVKLNCSFTESGSHGSCTVNIGGTTNLSSTTSQMARMT